MVGASRYSHLSNMSEMAQPDINELRGLWWRYSLSMSPSSSSANEFSHQSSGTDCQLTWLQQIQLTH